MITTTFSTIDAVYETDFSNLKILLAEDNEVNQLLAKGILRYWGAKAMVATTGYEVLELIEQEDFDLVLMDIQMPEKSGIEAATEIRNLADQRKKNIPIIALTANAVKGEEKKYIAAGMDDFLTKPFKEGELYEVIERVMRKEGAFGRKTSYKTNDSNMEAGFEMPENLYDLKQLEEIGAGNPEFLTALAQIFLDTIPGNSSEMVAASKTGDWEKVSSLAHKLKATIDNLNMHVIAKEIRTIEMDAKNKVRTDAIKTMVVKVDNVIIKVAEQLKQRFSL